MRSFREGFVRTNFCDQVGQVGISSFSGESMSERQSILPILSSGFLVKTFLDFSSCQVLDASPCYCRRTAGIPLD